MSKVNNIQVAGTTYAIEDADSQEALTGKASIVELSGYVTSGAALPFKGAYVYQGIPVQTISGYVDSTYYLAFCIEHHEDGAEIVHKILVFIRESGTSNYTYSETFYSVNASSSLEKHIVRSLGGAEATSTYSGLMSAGDKATLNNLKDDHVIDKSVIDDNTLRVAVLEAYKDGISSIVKRAVFTSGMYYASSSSYRTDGNYGKVMHSPTLDIANYNVYVPSSDSSNYYLSVLAWDADGAYLGYYLVNKNTNWTDGCYSIKKQSVVSAYSSVAYITVELSYIVDGVYNELPASSDIYVQLIADSTLDTKINGIINPLITPISTKVSTLNSEVKDLVLFKDGEAIVANRPNLTNGMYTVASGGYRTDGAYGKVLHTDLLAVNDYEICIPDTSSYRLSYRVCDASGNHIGIISQNSQPWDAEGKYKILKSTMTAYSSSAVYVAIEVSSITGGTYNDIAEDAVITITAYTSDDLDARIQEVAGGGSGSSTSSSVDDNPRHHRAATSSGKGMWYNGVKRQDGNYGKLITHDDMFVARDFYIHINTEDEDLSDYVYSVEQYDDDGTKKADYPMNKAITEQDMHLLPSTISFVSNNATQLRVTIGKLVNGSYEDISESASFYIYTQDEYLLDAKGEGDFTTWDDAFTNVGDCAATPKTIIVNPGTYTSVQSTSANRAVSAVRNLTIRGVNKNNCIIRNDVGYYETGENYTDNGVIKVAGNVLIENLTLISTHENFSGDEGNKKAYCVHVDFQTAEGDITTIRNCKLVNEQYACVGIGLKGNFTVEILNCELISTIANTSYINEGTILCHESTGGDGVNEKLVVRDCVITNTNGNYAVNIHNTFGGTQELELCRNILDAQGDGFYYDASVHNKSKLCYGNNIASMNYSA